MFITKSFLKSNVYSSIANLIIINGANYYFCIDKISFGFVDLINIYVLLHVNIMLEYLIHRFILHNLFSDYIPNYFLYLNLHGIHHHNKYKNIKITLPPIFYYILLTISLFICHRLENYLYVKLIILHLSLYEITHLLCHVDINIKYFKFIKYIHDGHHKNNNHNYSITNPIIDYLFDTLDLNTKISISGNNNRITLVIVLYLFCVIPQFNFLLLYNVTNKNKKEESNS